MTPIDLSATRRRGSRARARWAGTLVLLAAVACTPEPPEKERPPEPQAAGHTQQLRDAIQAPIDRARKVEIDTQEAAAAQREAIEAATGG